MIGRPQGPFQPDHTNIEGELNKQNKMINLKSKHALIFWPRLNYNEPYLIMTHTNSEGISHSLVATSTLYLATSVVCW